MSAFAQTRTDSLQQILASVREARKSKGTRPAAAIALFAGARGTGKTLAAQAIADELGLDLFRVDLSRIVSKYIGETEKNLDRVFAEAESAGAVLLIDEADALFGKRSEVRDSHDRYANVDVDYLLQRMEAHGGLVILTTNNKKNVDAAFLRRLRFIMEFPRPKSSAAKHDVDLLKRELLRYLSLHPAACDTEHGIRDWWLGETGVAPADLAQALAELEKEGAMVRSTRRREEVWHAPKAGLDFTP